MTELVLVRHGETEWHADNRYAGRSDVALTPRGHEQAADLARWAAHLAGPDHGGALLASVAEMAAPVVIADPDGWTSGYGLGLQLWRRRERVLVGHTGSMPGYLAVVIVHRPSRTGVVAFANSYAIVGSGIGLLGLSIMEAVLDGEPGPAPTPWRSGPERG